MDPVAIAYWFEGVRIALGQKRPYGVEKLIEPEVFKKCKSGYSHNNKWRGYKTGKHAPSRAIIQKAEALCPGSAHAFVETFWNTARAMSSSQVGNQADTLLRQLPIDLMPLFFRIDPKTSHEIRRGVTDRILNALSRRTDLNGLAALSIVIREAAEKRQYKLLMQAGEHSYHLILRLATEGDERVQILLPKILDILRMRVLSFVRDRTHRFSLGELDSSTFCALLPWSIDRHAEYFRSLGRSVEIDKKELSWARGLVLPNGWVSFGFPIRPLAPDGRWAEDEKGFNIGISAWKEAIQLMQNKEL